MSHDYLRTRLSARNTLGGLMLLALPLSPFAYGQGLDGDEEVFTLSPFEVNAAEDEGYRAGNTVSGSRLNTSLKDTAASITAFTDEFLEDFNITSLEDLMSYGPNTDVDMLDTSADANPTFLGGSDFTNTRIRVRGLSASVSKDFLTTSIPIDGYNTSRTELSSGPNAILFGLGSPGGLVNVTTKRAMAHRNKTSVSGQFGSWDYKRFTVDHNQVLIEDKLAVRFNGVTENRNGWREFDFRDSEAGTLSVRFNPYDSASVNFIAEAGNYEMHVTRPMNIYDSVDLWLESDRPTSTSSDWSGPLMGEGIGRRGAIRVYYNTDHDGSDPYVLQTGRGVLELFTTYDSYLTPVLERAGQTLVSDDIIPFEENLYGPDSIRTAEYERQFINFEQKFGDDLFWELAYSRERTEQDVMAQVLGNLTLQGDPNEVIPGTDVVNNNAGEVFIESRWSGSNGAADQDVLRASLVWDLDTERFGRHQIALMGEHVESNQNSYGRIEVLVDENGVPINNANVPENNQNWIWRRNYVDLNDPSTFRVGSYTDRVDVSIDGVSYYNQTINNGGQDTDRELDSALIALQSFLLDNRLVFTAGIRSDKSSYDSHAVGRYTATDSEVQDGTAIVNERYFLPDEISSTSEYDMTTGTVGAVFHINEIFSIFYNEGTNNDAPRTNFAILPDETLPLPVEGSTKDFGFMMNLMDGKVYVRTTYYETEQINSVGGSFNIPLEFSNNNIAIPTARILDTLLENGIITDAEYTEHEIGNGTVLSGSSDIFNSGWNIDAWFNMSKNFTAKFNYSYSDTDRSSIVPEFDPWYERESAFWLSSPGAADLVNAESELTLAEEAANIAGIMASIREFYSIGYGISPHRINLTSRYTFRENKLKGLFVGGGFRWQDKQKVGREFQGIDAINRPILGDFLYTDERINLDAFVGYRTKVNWFGEKPSNLTVQLNVKNVTDEDAVVPLRYNQGETGYKRILLNKPREYRLRFGLDF